MREGSVKVLLLQFLPRCDSIELEVEKIGILKKRVERQDP